MHPDHLSKPQRTGLPQGTKVAAVIAAGGTGTRIGGDVPKQFLDLGGRPILLRTVESLLAIESIDQIAIALPAGHVKMAQAIFKQKSWPVPILCISGGATRQESVRRGIGGVSSDADLILVHDAVRPFCNREILEQVLEAAWVRGGAVPGIPATETIQRVSRRGTILKTPPREELYAIQTPQCFRADILRSALERAAAKGFAGTDESSVVRWAGHSVTVVPGSPFNIKVTHPLDLEVAEGFLGRQNKAESRRSASQRREMFRIGQGIDYHRLVKGRKLILGGVELPFEKGLQGHSDADVLAHAVCDALLGAAALGDIGRHFPNDDMAHRDRSSLEFLRLVRARLDGAGWRIRNVDATLLAQRPKLLPFVEAMRANLADALAISRDDVSIKATTTEGMNAEGRGEGISAQAVALLEGG